jgi:hypothetical protein
MTVKLLKFPFSPFIALFRIVLISVSKIMFIASQEMREAVNARVKIWRTPSHHAGRKDFDY